MSKLVSENVTVIALNHIARSFTNRIPEDKAKLAEMGKSIKERGVISPILVRPVSSIQNPEARRAAGKARFEIIYGEHRWLGSALAEMKTIPCLIREYDDRTALQVQLIENLQRVDLNELDEAQGYQRYLTQGGGTIENLAAKVGKSRTTIYGRIKLLNLPPVGLEALRKKQLSPQVLLLVARVINPQVAESIITRLLQSARQGEPHSVRAVQEMMAREFMVELKGAPFDQEDPQLNPPAGPCSTCPKRTGNQKETFKDVGRADVCTDPICYRAKRDQAQASRLAEAKQEGKTILSVKESEALFPYRDGSLAYNAPVVDLASPCPFSTRKQTWGDVIAKLPTDLRPAVKVAADKGGLVHEVIDRNAAAAAAKAAGIASGSETRGRLDASSIEQGRDLKKARERHEMSMRAINLAIDAILLKQDRARDNGALGRLLLVIAEHEAHFDTCRRVNSRHGFVAVKSDGEPNAYFRKRAKEALSQNKALSFALETLLWESSQYVNDGLTETIKKACEIYGVATAPLLEQARTKLLTKKGGAR